MSIRLLKRRDFIAVLGATAAWPVLARAQRPALPVIGFLHQGSPTDLAENSFRQGLLESGYPEARNVGIEHRWANYHYDQLPALVTDLLNRHVAVIAAAFLPAAQAAKAATQTVTERAGLRRRKSRRNRRRVFVARGE
jgi:putative tryptophan/tyrosine transport system substrate-binding protein